MPAPLASSRRLYVVAAFAMALGIGLLWRADLVLADDWLLGGLYADPVARTGLDWSTLLADHWTPWLLNEWGFYRPTATLCMGAWMQCLPADPARWNGLNVLLHATNVALLTALLLRLPLRWPAIAAAVVFAAVHPAVGEPLVWFSSVSDLVAVTGTLLATLGVCRHRAGQRGATLAWCLGVWIALTGKENGLVVLLVLPLVDRALGASSWRLLLREHAARTGPVLVLALLGRTVAGCLRPTGRFEGFDTSLAHAADSLASKAGLVLVPGLGLSPYLAAALAGAVLLAIAVCARRAASGVVAALLVLTAYLACGTFYAIDGSYLGSRLLYPAVFAAAVVLAGAASLANCRAARVVAVFAVAAVLAGASTGCWQRMRDADAASRTVARVTQSLRETYRALGPDELLCPLLVPSVVHATLAFVPNLLFPLVGAPGDANHLLPLTYLSSEVWDSRGELKRAVPLRVAAELAATMVNIDAAGDVQALPAAVLRGVAAPAEPMHVAADGTVRWPEPVSPLQLETVVVQAPGAAALRLRWLFGNGDPGPAGERFPVRDGEVRAQIGDDFILLAGLVNGGVTGVRVELEDADGRALACDERLHVRVSPTPDRLPPPTLARRELTLAQFVADGLEAPPASDANPNMRLGLLLPSSGVSFAVKPGRPVEVPRDVQRYLEWTLALAPKITVVAWFEERRLVERALRLGARTPAVRIVVTR